MSTSNLDQEKSRREQELRIQRQISFASGLFHGDITIRTLLESLAEGVVIIDSTETILLVNTAAEKMFGYQKEELIGKPHAVLIPERFRKVHEEHEANFFKEPRIRPMGQLLDLSARRRDGSEFPVEISLGFVETINGVLVLALVSDMTLRKEYESRLHESEEQFRIQVECVKDYAIFMLDAEGNVMNWNAGAERLKGYRDEEIIGRHFSCFFPEKDRDGGKPADELAEAAAGERAEFEGWRLRKDGSRFWAEDVVTALRDENGNLRGFSRVTHDITERRRAVQEIEQLNADLSARAAELERSNQDLSTYRIELESQNEELRRSRQEAERIRARYQDLYDFAPVGYFTLNERGAIEEVNLAGASFLGRARSSLANYPLIRSLAPESRNEFEHFSQRVLATGMKERCELRLVKGVSTGRWVLAEGIALVGGDDGCRVTFIDITERKLAEEELKSSEEKLRFALTAADIGIWQWDLVRDELTWSERCKTLFGYPADYPMTYEAFLRPIHEEDRQGVEEAVHRALQEKTEYLVEMRVVLTDGQTRWVMSKGRAFYDEQGKPVRMHGIAMDITERKQVQEALRFSEERYRALFRDNPVMIVTLDVNGTMLSVNPTCAGQLGYAIDELEGQSVLMLFQEDDRPAVTEQLRRCLQNPEQVYRWQFRKIRKDGEMLWVEETAQAVYALNGALSLLVVCQDITERKRAEESLRESEQRFASFMFHLPAAAWMKDLHGRYVYVNAEALRIFAKPLSSLLDKTDDELFPPETARQFRENDERVLADGGSLQTTEVMRQADGIEHHSIVSKFAVPGPDGQPAYVAGVAVDITESKRLEAEIQRLATFPLVNPNPILELDANGQMTFSNPAAKQILDTEGANFTTNPFVPLDMPVILQDLRDKKAGQFSREIEINACFFEVRLHIMPPFQSVRIYAMDITERKRAEEALRKSELKLSKIFHTVPALIAITTVDEGRCIDINETGLRTLGYRREEVVGKTMLELGVWESKSARDRLIRVLEENGMVRDLEINFRGRDGKMFTGLFSAELVDFNGNRYMLSIVNDITERKRMEEEIERLNTDLAARAFGLEVANRELEAFNYTVAHDLRKPLAVVNGYCQALEELCGDRLDEACRGYLREAYDGTLRMNRLIDALLSFSQLAHVELRRESVDLSALAHEVAAELQLSEPERRVAFRIAEGAVVNGDANLLRVVLDNLLGNAWKYTGMREEAVIEFGVMEFDGKPAWFVRDNGAGFDMADAEKLFVPFQRLPGAEEFKGFGIGLATVARIIERHGGRLWAEGEPDKGAIFYFTL